MEEAKSKRRRVLSGVEWVGLGLGLALSLAAAALLIAVADEARRLQDLELTQAGRYTAKELWAVWLASSLLGGLGAAWVARRLTVTKSPAGRRSWRAHLGRLLVGSGLVAVYGPLVPGLVLGAVDGRGLGPVGCYLATGSFIGWQAGMITFVFLYTFHALQTARDAREVPS